MQIQTIALIVLFVAVQPSGLNAQRVESVDQLGIRPRVLVATAKRGENRGAIRLGASVAGAALGLVVGGFAGYNLLPHRCECDDPGLDELVLGALAGGAVGAALGAAFPALDSVCTFNQRFKRTILGGVGGAALGFLLGGGLAGAGTTLFVTPALSVGGSLASLGDCSKSQKS